MTIHAADLFCGAGGTSTGLIQACRARGLALDLTAVNHWPVAIATHAANHPWARHLCESLDGVDPRKVIGRSLDLLVASPECTHHSRARGGVPCSDQSRSTAWHVLRWAEALRPKAILIENVGEFQQWGPLGSNGKPLQRRKGELFDAWVRALQATGYHVDYRVLCAANYGDPTTRERFFLLATRARNRIGFPTATHGADAAGGLFSDGLPRWHTAREIIDWSLPSQSIFARKRPLKNNTLERIAAGLRKLGGAAAEPFLVMLYGTGTVRSVHEPLPKITAGGEHIGLVEPFVMAVNHGGGHERRCVSVERPLPTVTCEKSFGLVEPYIIQLNHGIGDKRSHSLNSPMPTLTTLDAWGLVQPFVVSYYGSGTGVSGIESPLPTVTTHDRFGLVTTARGPWQIDIRFRMLTPKELAAAMSFPRDYRFCGTRREIVQQIGNAVPVATAEALCTAVLSQIA